MTTALLDFSKPHVLKDEAEYDAAVAEIERLLDDDVERGSEGYDRLEFLSVLVEHYEDERYAMGAVTPQQAVRRAEAAAGHPRGRPSRLGRIGPGRHGSANRASAE